MTDDPRLDALRRFLQGLAPVLELDLAVRLWDHYDVSNAFYRLFLDPGDGLYLRLLPARIGTTTSPAAQRDKLDMICRKLRLKPGERLLDIGCGWGALICHAAQHYGVKATA
jgi:cyclopropane-fatty-acyl-phospholipid synthase